MFQLIALASAALATGAACWLAPASIHIVGWSPGSADRVAVFAPLYRLWIALGGAALAAALLRWRGVRADIVAPAQALWLWALPYAPWLPARFPVLLLLAGPVKWWIAAVTIAVIAVRVARARRWQFGSFALPRPTALAVVFLASLAFYVVCGVRSLDRIGVSGDEPHYLVIAHSLLVDHDLQIENNHRQGDYRAFFDDTLQPDYLRRGVDEQIYSIHAPGLPVLVMPGYAIDGARGAIVTVCVFAALAAVAIFDTALSIGGFGVAWVTCLLVCIAVPVVPLAWSLYPETIALAVVAWAVRWSEDRSMSDRAVAWFARGGCLAVLPWLHTKFVVILAAFAVWMLVRLRRRIRVAIAFVAPIAVSLVAWLTFFDVIYGTFDPQAPYGSTSRQVNQLANIPRSLLGMLVDQKFGLLIYAPAYVAAIVGAWLALTRPRWRPFALGLIATAALFVVASARFYMWWGGSSAPARFLVPIVPLLAALVALALTESRAPIRGVIAALASVNVIVALVAVTAAERKLLFSNPHGTSNFVHAFEGSVPLDAMLPTFTEERWPTGGRVSVEAQRESALRGRVEVLEAFDPDCARAFDYTTQSKISAEQWIDRGRIELAGNRTREPLTLPPGRYDVRAWSERDANPTLVTIDQPLATPHVLAQVAGTPNASRIDVVPRSIVPAHERPDATIVAIDPIRDRAGAFIAYTDDNAHAEGGVFWTHGTMKTRVLVGPAGAREMMLTLRIGPAGGTVSLDAAGQRQQIAMGRDEMRTVSVAVPSGAQYVTVGVASSTAFRPSEHDPQSTDRRPLGCQVRIDLR